MTINEQLIQFQTQLAWLETEIEKNKTNLKVVRELKGRFLSISRDLDKLLLELFDTCDRNEVDEIVEDGLNPRKNW